MIEIFDTILMITMSVYALGLLFFFIGLFFPNKRYQDNVYQVSVIVAVRDEEENIGHLLSSVIRERG